MKRFCTYLLLVLLVSSVAGFASPLGTVARNVIPSDVQQIICVDYRNLKNSPTALALKDKVLPENMKLFETALRGVGIDPDKDLEQLTFASFRAPKQGLRMVGIAQGTFPTKRFLQRMKLKKVKPLMYRTNELWNMAGGMQMSFLDDFTLVFGEAGALKTALDARDSEIRSLNYNTQITDMIGSVESGVVWSVLDQIGTQNMMRSALGDAAQLADFDVVKKRLLSSRYMMDFDNGVKFDMDVITPDSFTASTLSALIKAGMLYRKASANAAEKVALDNMTVDSDSTRLQMHFRTDDKKFQSLLSTELFAAVSR